MAITFASDDLYRSKVHFNWLKFASYPCLMWYRKFMAIYMTIKPHTIFMMANTLHSINSTKKITWYQSDFVSCSDNYSVKIKAINVITDIALSKTKTGVLGVPAP